MQEELHTKIKQIESLLIDQSKSVPFHNLFMLNQIDNKNLELGGTCSDKVLYFKEVLSKNNIKTRLHSSLINGIDCHRMLSVILCEQKYYIDIGSGWPMLKLIPENSPIKYEILGMYFKTEIMNSEINIYHKTRQEFKKTIVIPKKTKPEKEIMEAIDNRYVDTSIYPFHTSLRYSVLKEDAFYFLKKNKLRMFNSYGIVEKKLSTQEIVIFLRNEFKEKVNLEIFKTLYDPL